MNRIIKILNSFVIDNFFIAICSIGMVFSTFLLNNIPLTLSPFIVFLALSTYLLYNFHRISFYLDFSRWRKFFDSMMKVNLGIAEKLFFIISISGILICIFQIHPRIYPYLLPLAFLAISYSVPLFGKGGSKRKLREFYLIKTPVLAAVWGFTTTIIPLVEYNISLESSFVGLQIISRTLFVFALCIPFEMRDMEIDKKNNIRTLAVICGLKNTRLIGLGIVALEIITHHLMVPLSSASIYALDLSSLVAMFLILIQNEKRSPFFYKLYVDGNMLIRFIFLFIAIKTQ